MTLNKLAEHNVGYRAWPEQLDPRRHTIVMIHGAGGRTEIWNGQLRHLGAQFNAVAIDLPGHGATPGNGFNAISDYATWLVDILDACFDAPVVLMGHSMGGAICQQATLQGSERIKALVLVGTGPRLKVAPAFLEGLKKNFEPTVDLIIKYAYSSSAQPLMISQGADLMKQAGPEVLYNDFAACDAFDVRDRIGKVELPTLVICGKEDKLTPPSLCRKLNESIRNSKMIEIPGAGHMVMIEAWRPFNEAVIDFVKGLP